MNYRYSDVERHNLDWFSNDPSKATLVSIQLHKGSIRGLHKFELNMKYPITAIAGRNGSGKTTILAMAACAFHNKEDGFTPYWRKSSYYTFSDFFIQAKNEIPPSGVLIYYNINYNKWKKSDSLPTGIGVGCQIRYKNQNSRWNNYSGRVNRDVVYFGVNRVVPHSEISVSRSYCKYFTNEDNHGWEDQVRNIVGRILNTQYDAFWNTKHSHYRLPNVTRNKISYSGFNMGAGESALFSIFSIIFTCSPGALLVIDEIELGLHEEAQARLIDELNKICDERHIQVICTTHSYNIIKNLPPESRFYIENIGGETIVTPGIGPDYAAGKLSGENSNELDIFVEDEVAKSLVETCLNHEMRRRISIISIGSSFAVIRQLSARYKEIKLGKVICILDGDEKNNEKSLISKFKSYLERNDDWNKAESWLKERLVFLPGDTWPELWIFNKLIENPSRTLAEDLKINESTLLHALNDSISSGKHNELFTLAKCTNLHKDYICNICCRTVTKEHSQHFEEICNKISNFLG